MSSNSIFTVPSTVQIHVHVDWAGPTALQKYQYLWSDKFLSMKFDGENTRSNIEGKTVKQTGKIIKHGMSHRYWLWSNLCHCALIQGHAIDSKCSQIAQITLQATYRSKQSTPGHYQDYAASNSWRMAPTMSHKPHLPHPRYFGHFRFLFDRVPVWLLMSDFNHQTPRKMSTRDYDFGKQIPS